MIHHRKQPVLYVDDTIEQRYAMRRILETEGYSVLEAGSGREALRLLESGPSLAVVDVKLPDINGYELTRQIKQHYPFLPILQVSASFSNPSLRASGLSGGADAYIAQPVHPPELIAVVKRLLQTTEAEESLRFLAGFGPQLSASLSLPETCESICNAVIPHFADHCILMLRGFPGRDQPYWSTPLTEDDPRRQVMIAQAAQRTPRMIDTRSMVASLFTGNRGFGAIGFFLDDEREYSPSDQILATDIANRTSLALQNCMLLATEQAARSALIQSEKLATAGRMAAAIAHEVNNPLEALTNLIYLLEISPDASPRIREIAATALGEISRLAHITRQTLGFYRELRAPTNLDLSQSVIDTLDLYQKRQNEQQVSFKLDLSENLPIRGIKGEIRQVISNLVVNAMEAAGPGGIITISTRKTNDKAVLVVADNGPGIDASTLPKIFEPFYTTKQGTGTGLGLWISQNIIEKHDGTIVASSRTSPDERGTEFVLTFPLVPERAMQTH
ncbi:MAG TPA: ATP-binding protein [Acidobacteriaceae bacterium]|nr:ATP-binding protein [Acidobacteriaceae bacterium]